MNISTAAENRLEQLTNCSETETNLLNKLETTPAALKFRKSCAGTETQNFAENDEVICDHFESTGFNPEHSALQSCTNSQGNSIAFRNQENTELNHSLSLFCKRFKVKFAAQTKNVLVSVLAIVVELILTVLYVTNIFSVNTVIHFSLGLTLFSIFTVVLECSRKSDRRSGQAPLNRSSNLDLQQNQRRTDNFIPENDESAEDLYNQMLRRILVSRMQLNYINHSLNRLQRQVELIESSLLNLSNTQMYLDLVQDIDFDNLQNIEDFLLQNNTIGDLSQAKGLAVDEIDRIMPVQIFQLKDTSDKQNCEVESKTCCTICLEGFEPGQIIRVSPCVHIFHHICIDNWLGIRSTCPNCKRELQDLDEKADD